MTINQAFPSVNDIESSWAEIGIAFNIDEGVTVRPDMSAIKWSRKVTVGTRKGPSGGRPMARTRGEIAYDASGTFSKGGLSTLEDALVERAVAQNFTRGNQVLISLVAFDIVVQHTPIGSTDIFEVWLKGCRYLEDSEDNSEGTDPDAIEVVLNPIEIVKVKNGREIALI